MTKDKMSEEVYIYGRTHMKYCSCGNACDWDKLAEDDGFAGFVTVGQVFEI